MRSGAIVVCALLAGCVGAPALPLPGGEAAQPPAIDVSAVLADVRTICDEYPNRYVNGTSHVAARAWMAERFETLGFDVRQDPFVASNRFQTGGTPTGGIQQVSLANVAAFKWGPVRDEWVVVGGHLDSVEAGACAAYDNGSGMAATLELARAFAPLALDRTLVFVAFDGEEQGTKGSRHMVENLTRGTWIESGTVVAMVDFDMVGISHPHPSKLSAEVTSAELKGSVAKWAQAVGVPEERINYGGGSPGGSDDAAFEAVLIPTVQFSGNQDDPNYGPLAAPTGRLGYLHWHRYDTYETMVQAAGGEGILRQGMLNALSIGAGVTFDLARGLTPEWGLE